MTVENNAKLEKIICSECGVVISENDDVCPFCGCPINTNNNKSKSSKNIAILCSIVVLLFICIISFYFINTSMILPQRKIAEVNTLISEYSQKSTLTQLEANQLSNAYDELTKKDSIDKAKFDQAIELRSIEKAAIGAVNDIKSILKSSDSFKLLDDVEVKDIEGGNGFYYVTVKYSAENSFGGTNDSSCCLAVSSSFEALFLNLSILTGNVDEVLNGTAAYSASLESKAKAYTIDSNRVMQNLNVKLS